MPTNSKSNPKMIKKSSQKVENLEQNSDKVEVTGLNTSNSEQVVDTTDEDVLSTPVVDQNEISDDNEISKIEIKSQEISLVDESQEILELIKMSQGILSQLSKGIRTCTVSIKRMEKDITKHNKRKDKNKNSKGKNGNKALKQLKPIFTETMTNFFKDNQGLHDRNDIQICESLTYESDGTLLVSRDQALKMVTSYIRVNELQKYEEDKRRIKMDDTLNALFPELAEVKKGSKVTQEENCYFSTLMGAIAKHFKQN